MKKIDIEKKKMWLVAEESIVILRFSFPRVGRGKLLCSLWLINVEIQQRKSGN